MPREALNDLILTPDEREFIEARRAAADTRKLESEQEKQDEVLTASFLDKPTGKATAEENAAALRELQRWNQRERAAGRYR